ncbi:hypothetical protein D3C81_1447230 [compost metagenome]
MYLVPFSTLNRISEIRDKRHEIHQLFLVRVFMNPIYKRNLHPMEMLCHRFVCCKHELFDNLLGNGTLTLHNVDRFAVLVYDNLRFLKIEVNGPATHAV